MAAAASATHLASYVNKLLAAENAPLDVAADVKKAEYGNIVKAVVPRCEQLLTLEVENDVEGCFTLLLDVLRQLPNDEASKFGQQLLDVVLSKTDDKPVLRLRIASNLFNKSVGLADLRLATLLRVIQYSATTKHLELVASYFDNIDALFDASTLTPAARRQLYLAIADVLATLDESKPIKVLLFLEKYLNTFTEATSDAAAKAVAVRATRLVLQQPIASFIARVDLVANPVVAALAKDKDTKQLYEFLQILSTKTLVEFQAFQKAAGAAFFTKYELEEAEIASTMRLFTLCTLPTGFDEISFRTIATALSVEEADVEAWIVKAITSNLITAKVDQLRHTVVITRTFQRSFGEAQWQEIAAKLALYKKNVGTLLDVVRRARQAQQQQ